LLFRMVELSTMYVFQFRHSRLTGGTRTHSIHPRDFVEHPADETGLGSVGMTSVHFLHTDSFAFRRRLYDLPNIPAASTVVYLTAWR